MRLFISLIFSLALIGCSHTTVHLNTRYLNDDQIKQVVDTIEDHNINVRVNNHPFPRQVDRSTLMHSPTMAIRHPEKVDKVRDLLNGIGWELQGTDILVASNHRFTERNLGLFLVPENTVIGQGRSISDLAQIYQSVDCELTYQIRLNFDGSFEFNVESSSYISFDGKWEITDYPYIRLFQEESYLNFYYQVVQKQVLDNVGIVNIIALKPLSQSSWLPICKVEYGIRE